MSVVTKIISGGGSAGAVVANRLSENPYWKVLLLEAGPDESEASDIPALATNLQLGKFDWKYKTKPQPGRACLGHVQGQCNWPRGKVRDILVFDIFGCKKIKERLI